MNTLSNRLMLVSLLVAISIIAKSQEKQNDTTLFESTFSMFREPSYISALGGFGNIEPLVFEGDIVPYFTVNKSKRWGIELSPRFILRMYNEKSLPVRTPSFMPKGTIFFRISTKNNNTEGVFTYLSWVHHSNGQSDSFYNEDTTAINTNSGNFSTNYIEGGMFFSKPDKRFPNAVTNYMKLSVLYHYHQAPELRPLYGRLRFFTDFQSSFNLSKALKIFRNTSNNSASHNAILRQSIRIGLITGDMVGVNTFDTKRLIFRYTISYKPTFLSDVNLFVQYYYGQDYYNIYFDRTLKVLRFGLSAKTSIFE